MGKLVVMVLFLLNGGLWVKGMDNTWWLGEGVASIIKWLIELLLVVVCPFLYSFFFLNFFFPLFLLCC